MVVDGLDLIDVGLGSMVGLLDEYRPRIPAASKSDGEVVSMVQHPHVALVG
jgi:hypothetical protein